jgi:DNA invertase Pin-like site-specific DNA recombinase
MQRLLEDIRAGHIDIVIAYKIDRLSRSLFDFAELVKVFDQHGVTFVSVTQQFNTTDAMGRMLLNILLTFAQFERELTAERIRDKMIANKKKGLLDARRAAAGLRPGRPPLGGDA